MRYRMPVMLIGIALTAVWGCPPEDYATFESATLREIDAIRNDDTLAPETKRERLEELGLSPTAINALLQEEERANQFGGTLRTAYDKVIGGRFHRLTPDEVQIYAEEATKADVDLGLSPTDAEAQAVTEFFQFNDIRTEEDLVTYLENPDNPVPSTIPDNLLRPLFIDFDTDLLLPLLP